jgi:3-phosphoshikimate 1-carboxyvinyltransferase
MNPKKFDLILNKKILPFKKTINVDSDKSISIRSLLISSISQGSSLIKNTLESEDVISAINCLKKLGVKISKSKKGEYLVFGKGLGSFQIKKGNKLNFGNSGTLARLLIGILSTTPNIKVYLSGDRSLNNRSMKNLIELMSQFGAQFYPKNKFKFPLRLISSELPIKINYKAGVSAQLKSAVILAGLNSYGNTIISEIERSRDHTENMLLDNPRIITIKNEKIKTITICGKRNLKPLKINVPSDPSSAAFFSALTLLNKNSSIIIKNVCLNPTRTGFYQLLKKQGAKIKFQNLKTKNNELRGDVIVKSCNLKPIKASKLFYTTMTDEYPILFIMASLIKGVSSFKGISDLANKESNRIIEMQNILKQINIKSTFSNGELKIFGQGMFDASNKTINVPNKGDHRLCMSSFILALLTGAKTTIKNFETVFTSSPSFLKIMKNNLGVAFEIKK